MNNELAGKSKAWPFEEARAVLKKIGNKTPAKGFVLFETGYGPSGLPHIGTFAEVFRTTMVRHAFSFLSDRPTKLFAFSDDMDGLRKVPDNIPNKEMVAQYLEKPLTSIPDPFGKYESFGHHNNARLRSFLDQFGFDYTFKSSTELYKTGVFDTVLLGVLENYEAIMNTILPTLRAERQKTYSPFLPICPRTGKVLQVPVLERKLDAGTIIYENPETHEKVETPVTKGHCKLQWKIDWAMRWTVLDVDYEMAGKDLLESVNLSSKVCRILGGRPPVGFSYELFLDEKGEKISKSKGNGLSVEEWLKYAPKESLSYFMFNKPRQAKRLFFDVIPKTVDEYLFSLESFPKQSGEKQVENPVWFIHQGTPPHEAALVSFNILLNLASVCHSEDKTVLWHYISRYNPQATPATSSILDGLVEKAISYFRDFVKPNIKYRAPTAEEILALQDLKSVLRNLSPSANAEEIQTQVYEVGKRHSCFADLKAWFKALYQILLGQEEGPRMGTFVMLFGIKETITLIEKTLGENPG